MYRNNLENISLRVMAVTFAFLLGACSNEEVAKISKISAGKMFYEATCLSCHGEGGFGDGPMAEMLPVRPPPLSEHLAHHPIDQLVQIIRDGVPPAMPPTPLTDDEIRLVIDYTWTLVPDSLVEELREMQREVELGVSTDTQKDTINGLEDSSSSIMSGMTHSEQMEPSDTNKN
jgi:mono/diheme cytochrome c family protein|tara:strand:- start:257 stop:778 length:522 start_codon:yes stop_codon:yes gene_type:complete